jgi:5-methylcytosine-specific restriction endonuclease McrA
MSSHREWLLERYGPICSYCGREFAPEVMTLDHVRPRKGQTAYDRPDNLVFACRDCNASKADTPLMAFLLARRSRAVFLLEYGEHLSEALQELAQQVAHRPLLGE